MKLIYAQTYLCNKLNVSRIFQPQKIIKPEMTTIYMLVSRLYCPRLLPLTYDVTLTPKSYACYLEVQLR